MRVLKYIFLLLLLIIIAGSIYIATLEKTYDVKRTRVIKAPIEVVYNNVNDFKNWQSWSPWLSKDSLAVLTFGEITSGEGASQSWKSEVKEVGVGAINTINAKQNETINQKLVLTKPWESTSDIYWSFKPVDNGTEVIWGMKGELGFMSRVFMVFSGGMDKQVGLDYERGLFKLDSVVQVEMQKYSVTVNGETTHGGGFYLYNTTSCKIDELPVKMQEMMPKVRAYAQKNKIQMAGAPFTIYHTFDEDNNAVMFSSAVPVAERVITESGSGILTGQLKPFKAIKTTLKGDYKNLKEAWETANEYLVANKFEQVQGAVALEVYVNDPKQTPNPANLVTEIFIPIKE
ncbi:MAG TPA: transcription activator effector-binding protein [Flavobacteriaceae bacterium]|jgi:effector-binding domain-containing protein|nr:transcription activator effector-binding protein [Flavobacteriaceae bacterium]HBS13006.1 transcription activator effector-binding protein [Flavobacteriaceae bacterium]